MTPGSIRCSALACGKLLPVRFTEEEIKALEGKTHVIITVQCPKCWHINRVRAEDVERAA